jgi:hypothetical protein
MEEDNAMFSLNDALRGLWPSTALINLYAGQYQKCFRNGMIIGEIFLDRTSSNRTVQEVAQFDANQRQIREACRSPPALRAAIDRLTTEGVSFSLVENDRGLSDFRDAMIETLRRNGGETTPCVATSIAQSYSPSFDSTQPVLVHSRSRSCRNAMRFWVMSTAQSRLTK